MTRFVFLFAIVLALCSNVLAQTSPKCAQAPNLACASGTPATQDVVTTWNFKTGGATAFTIDGTTPDVNKITVSLSGDPVASFTATIPFDAASAMGKAISCGAGEHVSAFSATTGAFTCTADSGGTHTLLDGSIHTDTVAQTVSRGSIVYGNATPKWDELTIGGANTFLHSDGTDAAWAAISSSDIGAGDLASALTWNEVCTTSPCTLAAAPRTADTALVFWRTLKLRRVAACGGINEYTLSTTTLTLCDSTGIGAGVDSVQVTYEL